MDFIKVECATCQRPLLAAAELRGAVDPSELKCMLCKPARYPFCLGCQLPLYVSNFHDAPDYCSECRSPQGQDEDPEPSIQLYLEGFIEDTAVPRRVMLESFPFTIGCSSSSSLQINRAGVSRNHAHIDKVDGRVQVTDLDSKNGTYVDRKRIAETTPLRHGDIIHFADYEFRLLEVVEQADELPDICETMVGDSPSPLSAHFPTKTKELTELLEEGLVQGYYQTIVDQFGAGQARLLELVKEPPDILKFDYSLITGLTSPEAPTYQLVKTLTELVQQTGIKTLAEGVESEDVVRTCHQLGIDYIQGFFYSRPAPILLPSKEPVSVA